MLNLSNINWVDLIFIGFTLVMVIFGSLLNLAEAYLPASITQSFRYGKHAYKGAADPLVSHLEVPKSWFKHFYAFAAVYSSLAYFFVLKVYIGDGKTPGFVTWFLDFACGANREVKTSSIITFVGATLITLQCLRRCYETQMIQIFSSKSKINLSHYFVGYLHYFGTVTAILAKGEGFKDLLSVGSMNPHDLSIDRTAAVFVFLYAWWHQLQSNLILANMRKDSKGKIVTERHLMPRGGYFELVSSPHMFFEIVMYVALLVLLRENSTFVWILLWVVSNQTCNALLTHQWYKETFKGEYPKERKAIFPSIL